MQREIEIVVPAQHTDWLLERLQPLDIVVGLAVWRGGSLKPAGDLIKVQSLNRAADTVLQIIEDLRGKAEFSVGVAELSASIDTQQQEAITNDSDDSLWDRPDHGQLLHSDGDGRRDRSIRLMPHRHAAEHCLRIRLDLILQRRTCLSLAGAVAGMVIVVTYRDVVMAGPLIAIALIPAASLLGVAVAALQPDMTWAAVKRFGLDVLLVFIAGMLIVWFKQRSQHQRKPIM